MVTVTAMVTGGPELEYKFQDQLYWLRMFVIFLSPFR